MRVPRPVTASWDTVPADRTLHAMLDRLVGPGAVTPGAVGRGARAVAPRVGVDLVHIPRVRALAERHGARWLADHFTEREQAELAVVRGGRAATLAGRIAAKEAFIKLLAPRSRLVLTRDIEVLRAPGGAPLARPAAGALAELRSSGIDHWSLSITHEGEWALAVAVGSRPVPAPDPLAPLPDPDTDPLPDPDPRPAPEEPSCSRSPSGS
ncbi:holo-ACP synthase [Kitasatospora sp. NBC_01539]|uniref:holo-ACP synthase n=1 Tax=Kitasatospora sp. NBC_01539 TaxID=2903577 RepID=UPI00386030D0